MCPAINDLAGPWRRNRIVKGGQATDGQIKPLPNVQTEGSTGIPNDSTFGKAKEKVQTITEKIKHLSLNVNYGIARQTVPVMGKRGIDAPPRPSTVNIHPQAGNSITNSSTFKGLSKSIQDRSSKLANEFKSAVGESNSGGPLGLGYGATVHKFVPQANAAIAQPFKRISSEVNNAMGDTDNKNNYGAAGFNSASIHGGLVPGTHGPSFPLGSKELAKDIAYTIKKAVNSAMGQHDNHAPHASPAQHTSFLPGGHAYFASAQPVNAGIRKFSSNTKKALENAMKGLKEQFTPDQRVEHVQDISHLDAETSMTKPIPTERKKQSSKSYSQPKPEPIKPWRSYVKYHDITPETQAFLDNYTKNRFRGFKGHGGLAPALCQMMGNMATSFHEDKSTVQPLVEAPPKHVSSYKEEMQNGHTDHLLSKYNEYYEQCRFANGERAQKKLADKQLWEELSGLDTNPIEECDGSYFQEEELISSGLAKRDWIGRIVSVDHGLPDLDKLMDELQITDPVLLRERVRETEMRAKTREKEATDEWNRPLLEPFYLDDLEPVTIPAFPYEIYSGKRPCIPPEVVTPHTLSTLISQVSGKECAGVSTDGNLHERTNLAPANPAPPGTEAPHTTSHVAGAFGGEAIAGSTLHEGQSQTETLFDDWMDDMNRTVCVDIANFLHTSGFCCGIKHVRIPAAGACPRGFAMLQEARAQAVLVENLAKRRTWDAILKVVDAGHRSRPVTRGRAMALQCERNAAVYDKISSWISYTRVMDSKPTLEVDQTTKVATSSSSTQNTSSNLTDAALTVTEDDTRRINIVELPEACKIEEPGHHNSRSEGNSCATSATKRSYNRVTRSSDTRTKSNAKIAKPFRIGIRGLRNRGNWCYQNSVIQALFNIPAFRHAVLHASTHSSNLEKRLNELFGAMYESDASVLIPERLWSVRSDVSAEFSDDSQQDAQLYLLNLLDKLTSSSEIRSGVSGNIATNHRYNQFSGEFRQQIICTNEASGACHLNNDPTTHSAAVFTLTVPVSCGSVQNGVSAYLEGNDGSMDPEFPCNFCKQRGTWQITRTMTLLPQTLIVSINRFKTAQGTVKNTGHVKCDDILRLSSPNNVTNYKLSSIIRHHGQTKLSGHYTTCSFANDGSSTLYNDAIVTPGVTTAEKDAYVVVYNRILQAGSSNLMDRGNGADVAGSPPGTESHARLSESMLSGSDNDSVNSFETAGMESPTRSLSHEDLDIDSDQPAARTSTHKTVSDADNPLADREVATTSKTQLTMEEVQAMFASLHAGEDVYRIATMPPAQVKSGEVYVYQLKYDDDFEYTKDQISTWKSQGPGRRKKGPIKMRYWNLKLDNNILKENTRRVYSLRETDKQKGSFVIIHYVGNESLFVSRKHGNRIHGVKPTVTSTKSVLDKVKQMASTNFSPSTLADDDIERARSVLASVGVSAARNAKQISNYRTRIRDQLHLDKDEIYAIYDMSRTSTGSLIIHKFSIAPTIQIVVADPHVLSFAKVLLEESSRRNYRKQLLSMDTTFNLSQCYVSVLTMRNVLTTNDAIFPVAFLIHQTKDTTSHSTFWEIISKELDLQKYVSEVAYVTDKEEAIRSSIRKHVPGVRLYVCHNHLLKNVESWIRRNPRSCTRESIKGYMKSVRKLLQAENEERWDWLFNHYCGYWSPGFLQYLRDHKLEDLRQSSKFNYEKEPAFAACIPTNNISESTNSQIKHYIGHTHDMRLDTLVMALHHHQLRLLSQFSLAFGPSGRLSLRDAFQGFRRTITLPKYGTSQEAFVKVMKGELEALRKEDQSRAHLIPAASIQASEIASSNLVSLNSACRTFVITDPVSRRISLVQLDRESLCYKSDCGAVGLCLHVKAVLLAQDMQFDVSGTPSFLPSLMTKIKKRFGKSGRKRPAPGDEDFILHPAADSRLGQSLNLDDLTGVEDSRIGKTAMMDGFPVGDPESKAATGNRATATPRFEKLKIQDPDLPATAPHSTERAIKIAKLNLVHLDSASRAFQVMDDVTLKMYNVRFDNKLNQFVCDCSAKHFTCVHIKAVHCAQDLPYDSHPVPTYRLGVLERIKKGFGRLRRQRPKNSNDDPPNLKKRRGEDEDLNWIQLDMLREEEEWNKAENEAACDAPAPTMPETNPLADTSCATDPGPPAHQSTPKQKKKVVDRKVKLSDRSTKLGRTERLSSSQMEDGMRCIISKCSNASSIGVSPIGLCELVCKGNLEAAIQLAARHQLLDNDVVLQVMNTDPLGEGDHWNLGLISFHDKIICLLDSWLPNRNDQIVLSRAFRTLFTVASAIAASGGVQMVPSAWAFHVADDMPTQPNSYDCGLYCLLAISAIVNQRDLRGINGLRCRAWGTKLLSDARQCGRVGNYRRDLRIPEDLMEEWLKLVQPLAVLPQSVGIDISDIILEMLSFLQRNWTICATSSQCLMDPDHEQQQLMCVACRRWLHSGCEKLIKLEPPCPPYVYCDACFNGNTFVPIGGGQGQEGDSATHASAADEIRQESVPSPVPEAADVMSDSETGQPMSLSSSYSTHSMRSLPSPGGSTSPNSMTSNAGNQSPQQSIISNSQSAVSGMKPCFSAANIALALGEKKGIQWTTNSCAFDALLFLIFHSTTVMDPFFFTPATGDKLVYHNGLKYFANQLRGNGYVSRETMEVVVQSIRMYMPYAQRNGNKETDPDSVMEGLFHWAGDTLLEWEDERGGMSDDLLLCLDVIQPNPPAFTTTSNLLNNFTSKWKSRLVQRLLPMPSPALFLGMPWDNGRMQHYDLIIPKLSIEFSGELYRPTRPSVQVHLIGMITLSARHFVPYVKCGRTWLRMDSLPGTHSSVSECQGLQQVLEALQLDAEGMIGQIPQENEELFSSLYLCMYAWKP